MQAACLLWSWRSSPSSIGSECICFLLLAGCPQGAYVAAHRRLLLNRSASIVLVTACPCFQRCRVRYGQSGSRLLWRACMSRSRCVTRALKCTGVPRARGYRRRSLVQPAKHRCSPETAALFHPTQEALTTSLGTDKQLLSRVTVSLICLST